MPDPNFPPLPAGDGALYARLVTTLGSIVVRLEDERAPRTVANFVGLATGAMAWTDPLTGRPGAGPLYAGVRFHRVIDNFMAQVGDPLTRSTETASRWGTGGPGYRFSDEFHPALRHDGPGVLSMANSGPGSNGSQFFITHRATPHLDDRHSVFGRVVVGQDVLDAMGKVPKGARDRPETDVVLERVEIFRSTSEPTG